MANGGHAREPSPLAPRIRISPPQEIYALTGRFAREKTCQKMQNDDNPNSKRMGVNLDRGGAFWAPKAGTMQLHRTVARIPVVVAMCLLSSLPPLLLEKLAFC